MPSMGDFQTASIKCLYVGKPGAGKTGSLISIVLDDPEARLFIANFDRANIGTLANVMRYDTRTKQPRDPAVVASLARRIHYHNFTDDIRNVNGEMLVTGLPKAFADLGRKLNDWGDDLGNLNTWGPKDWLVLDSISAMGESAMRYALVKAQRLNKRPQIEDWGEAIARLSLLLEMTNDPNLACNIMGITHVRFVGDVEMGKDAKGQFKEMDMVPNAIGQQLPQVIGRFFNNIIEARVVGEGPGEQRKIYTRSPGGLVLRSSNPAMVKPEYPLETGMAQWVRDLRSVPQSAQPAPQPAAGTPTPVAQ